MKFEILMGLDEALSCRKRGEIFDVPTSNRIAYYVEERLALYGRVWRGMWVEMEVK